MFLSKGMMVSTEREIMVWLTEQEGLSPEKVHLGTRLGEDLGMDGDDAVEFFERFSRRYAVEMSPIRWDEHFGPEASFNPFSLLMPSFWRSRGKLLPITVKDLVVFAAKGRWTYDYPSGSDARSP